ncbi:LytTR family DNA-binding domain-containing protein [Paenibacillus wynnii]|uniref:HTH LytTR-type domain-containing protein n=1 Tax=Paenibacillus wynnii TaxID=268407 RepID=A0A098MB58_9BACL|nr:LytTR family DNA-binding domain-containing protein [Paenibacillus wynnii]KGE19785.1 hypothetical protein PWYN_10880 [Paenibacillus wynnii]
MEIIFEANSELNRRVAKITTHPAEKEHWGHIKEVLDNSEKKMVVINARNNRSVQISLSSIVVIESEDRMCSVRVITGEMYLLNNRLKVAKESLDSNHFIKINNQTIINTSYIKEFSSTDNARIKVILTDDSSYFVSRFYLKNFRGNLK